LLVKNHSLPAHREGRVKSELRRESQRELFLCLTAVPTCAGDGLFDVVSDLERESDALRLERDALRSERDAALEEVSSLRGERDALLLKMDAAAKERDALFMDIRQLALRLELTGEELRESEERCADLAAQVFIYRFAFIHQRKESSSSLDLCADLAAWKFNHGLIIHQWKVVR